MPLNGGNYVAPKWVDNAAPALDAKELQAMCDSIVKNQTEVGKIPGLQAFIDGKAQVRVFSYVGNGIQGESAPCSVTAGFPIDLLIYLGYASSRSGPIENGIRLASKPFMYSGVLRETYQPVGLSISSSTSYGKKSGDGKTFYWYMNRTAGSAHDQLNNTGYVYYFLATEKT